MNVFVQTIWQKFQAFWTYAINSLREFWTLRAPLFWALVISVGMFAPAQVRELYLINAEHVAALPGLSKYGSLETMGIVYLPILSVAFLVFWLRLTCFQIKHVNLHGSGSGGSFSDAQRPSHFALGVCALPQMVLFGQTFMLTYSPDIPAMNIVALQVLAGIQFFFVVLSLAALSRRLSLYAAWLALALQKWLRQAREWLNSLTKANLLGRGGLAAIATAFLLVVFGASYALPFGGLLVVALFLLAIHLPYHPNTFWSVAGLLVLAIVAMCMFPVGIGPRFGPLGILSLFACGLVLVASSLAHVEDRLHFPATLTVVGAAVAFSVFDLNDNHFLQTEEVALGEIAFADANDQSSDLRRGFDAWLKSRPGYDLTIEAGQRYPVYLVAAQGGGLYAAYQSAIFLAALQDQNPEFADHVFALSGVSGGSVGVTVFAALLASQNAESGPGSGCQPVEPPESLVGQTNKILRQDFLSPVGAAMLFPDMLARLLPFPVPAADRARALERSFENSFERATGCPGLEQHLLAEWLPAGSFPALFLNATDVDTGRRMVMTPFLDLGESGYTEAGLVPDQGGVTTWRNVMACPQAAVRCPSPKLSTAMLLSARFPLVTPAGSLALPARNADLHPHYASSEKARFADGGYFENSGLDTIADLIDELRKLDIAGKVVFRVLTFDFPQRPNPQRNFGLGELASPLRALGNARSARIEPARLRLLAMQDALWVDLISISLDDQKNQFPLGWTLSDYTFNRIACDLFDNAACVAIFSDWDDPERVKSGAMITVPQANREKFRRIVAETSVTAALVAPVLAPPKGMAR